MFYERIPLPYWCFSYTKFYKVKTKYIWTYGNLIWCNLHYSGTKPMNYNFETRYIQAESLLWRPPNKHEITDSLKVAIISFITVPTSCDICLNFEMVCLSISFKMLLNFLLETEFLHIVQSYFTKKKYSVQNYAQ